MCSWASGIDATDVVTGERLRVWISALALEKLVDAIDPQDSKSLTK
jgi:hypothetical protein